jgi:hypothetical protein
MKVDDKIDNKVNEKAVGKLINNDAFVYGLVPLTFKTFKNQLTCACCTSDTRIAFLASS